MDIETLQHTHPRRRRRLGALLLLSLLSGSVGAGALSLAVFGDTKASSGNIFTTGTVVLGVAPATAAITSLSMLPNDEVNGSVVVSNTGTAALRYAMTSTWSNTDSKALRDQLQLTVKALGASCAAFDGATLYSGAASGALFGNPAQGSHVGDRTLASGVNETLCFRVTLPLGTGDTFQNTSSTGTFTFTAEQTSGNP